MSSQYLRGTEAQWEIIAGDRIVINRCLAAVVYSYTENQRIGPAALQNQKAAVTAYLKSKQLLIFIDGRKNIYDDKSSPWIWKGVSATKSGTYTRVYLPLKVAHTPFHIQGDVVINLQISWFFSWSYR